MLCSMTGFGTAAYTDENVSISVEIKAVNNRHFKLSLKLTEGYNALEPRIEHLMRSVIERGTVNANIRILQVQENSAHQINTIVLRSYITQLTSVAATLDLPEYVPMLERFLCLPGVIVSECDNIRTDYENIWILLEKTIREALDSLQQMRKVEGESMAKDLTANIESMRLLISSIEEAAQLVAPMYQQKLKERIEKAMSGQGGVISNTDFVREIAVYADRCDVSEELVRFQSHLDQFTSIMRSNDTCGRKLDFLTQELFREVNTVGSKANDAEITKYVVEIKTIIERMREMVQNVE